jgi:ketosteroid isomerase-like protein
MKELRMTTPRGLALLLAGSLVIPTLAMAQRQSDVDAIDRLIDQYGELEDKMDMNAQAKLMTPDRVWITQGGGRRTDQVTNMRIQQANLDALKKQLPGIQTFTEDRDRLIKFYGNGQVAVASFYRYTTFVLPPNAPAELAEELGGPPPAAATLVLEKRDGGWKIVHTHFSNLADN